MDTEPLQNAPANHPGDVPGNESPRARPTVTFMGNAYDLTALGALASGVLILFMCGTCNMGFYCLPFVPLVLGLVGIIASRNAVDRQRTATFSWIALAIGIVVLILLAACVLLYFGMIGLIIYGEDQANAVSASAWLMSYSRFT
jgi:hypothetical protein